MSYVTLPGTQSWQWQSLARGDDVAGRTGEVCILGTACHIGTCARLLVLGCARATVQSMEFRF